MDDFQNARQQAAWRMNKLMGEEFLIFDTETTGFTLADEIIRISVIDKAGNVYLSSFIKPQQPITNSQYHGITDETVRHAPSFSELYPAIRAVLHDKIVLTYNLEYDMGMLDHACRRHELELIKPRVECCIMENFAAFYGEWNEYRGNFRWQKLRQAVAFFGAAFPGDEHDPIADCRAALLVMEKMAAAHTAEVSNEPD